MTAVAVYVAQNKMFINAAASAATDGNIADNDDEE